MGNLHADRRGTLRGVTSPEEFTAEDVRCTVSKDAPQLSDSVLRLAFADGTSLTR